MPLREDILVPIPGGNPSGIDLRYDSVLLIYDKIKEARRQDDDLPQGDWQIPRKTADFPLVVKLAQDAIATVSKDLQLAAWLTEALLQTEGFSGLSQGLELCLDLLTGFWETLYPRIEDGDRELRATPLYWIGFRLDSRLRSVPITAAGYSWFDWMDSLRMAYEGQVKTDKIPLEVFNKSLTETPRAFYEKAKNDLDGCIEALAKLGNFCEEKFEDDAPSFDRLKLALTELWLTIHHLLKRKHALEPNPVEAEVVEDSTSDPELTPAPLPHPGWFTGISRRTSTLSEEPPTQIVTDTSPIPPPATNPSRLKGFSTPGISDSASAEGSFTQFFKATSSAPPSEPQTSAEPSGGEIGGATGLIEPLSEKQSASFVKEMVDKSFEAARAALLKNDADGALCALKDIGEVVKFADAEKQADWKRFVEATMRALHQQASATAIDADFIEAIGDARAAKGLGRFARFFRSTSKPVAAKPTQTTLVSVFYATDRMQLPSLTNKTAFGKQRSLLGSLHYGRCEVSIPKTHKLGKLETPSILRLEFTPNPAKHIVLAGTFSLEEQKFFEMVQSSIAKSAARDAFVFVHGYNVSFENAARRTGQMAFDLNFVGAPIFYSWPSNGKTADYPKDETNVTWSTPHLQRFLALLAQNTSAKRIYVIAHSMGNRAVCDALKLLSYDPDCQLKLAHLVLAAPDIDADTFRELASMLQKLSGRITLYESSRDLALLASKKIHGNPRAGEPLLVLPGLDTIDASAIDTDFLGHSYFSDTWPLLSDIHSILFEDQPPERRFGLMAQENPGGRYYAFRA